jgi:hypothetical protein
VSLPSTSGTIVGKADRAVVPSRPFIRMVYKPGGVVVTQPCCSLTW